MQRPVVRLAIMAGIIGFIVFGVLYIGIQLSNHTPWYVGLPLLLSILVVWLFSEFTDG